MKNRSDEMLKGANHRTVAHANTNILKHIKEILTLVQEEGH